jgi:hypothetical protein
MEMLELTIQILKLIGGVMIIWELDQVRVSLDKSKVRWLR